jgi:hypothetical protein
MVGYSGYSGAGWTTDPSSQTPAAAATTLAHHRQRGEGSFPVGVSSRAKLAQASQIMAIPVENPAR